MTVQVIDLLKNIDIADDHCKGLFAALINVQDLFKRAAVQRIGQRIVLGLMADKLLRLLILAVDLIVGQRQLLQLGGRPPPGRFARAGCSGCIAPAASRPDGG